MSDWRKTADIPLPKRGMVLGAWLNRYLNEPWVFVLHVYPCDRRLPPDYWMQMPAPPPMPMPQVVKEKRKVA